MPPGLVVKNGLNSSAIVVGVDAGAAIRDHELDVAFAVDLRAQHDLAARFRHLEHRIDAVAHQIEDDLLDLHRVGLHLRRLRRRLQQHAHAVVTRVGLRERQHVFEQAIRLDQLAPHLAILDEGAQAADHLAGTQRLRADLIERGLDLVLARRRLRDQPLTRLRIRRDRGQRLIHFVRDARRHLAHGRDAAEVRDAILHLARFVFGAAAIGDVVQRADLPQHAGRPAARVVCAM